MRQQHKAGHKSHAGERCLLCCICTCECFTSNQYKGSRELCCCSACRLNRKSSAWEDLSIASFFHITTITAPFTGFLHLPLLPPLLPLSGKKEDRIPSVSHLRHYTLIGVDARVDRVSMLGCGMLLFTSSDELYTCIHPNKIRAANGQQSSNSNESLLGVDTDDHAVLRLPADFD